MKQTKATAEGAAASGIGTVTPLMPRKRRDEAHRAIGRYVVEFSDLVSGMREAIEHRLEAGDPMVAQLALGEANASQVANAFFAVCEHLTDFDDEEKQVAVRLKKEVTDAIKDRNDFAHGDWLLAQGEAGKELPGPTLRRTKPGRKAGASLEEVRSFEELEEMSNRVFTLSQFVEEFAWLCLEIHPLSERLKTQVRVRDIFRFSKHRVLRRGRYAAEPWWDGMPPIPVS